MLDLNPACNTDPFPDWPFGINSDRKVICRDEWVRVPLDVAECPYCGFMLKARPRMVTHDPIPGQISTITLRCRTADDAGDDADLSTHLETHSRQPYVHWMPVEKRVLEWMQETYQVPPDEHVVNAPVERLLFNEKTDP